jgi:hypothetical protein
VWSGAQVRRRTEGTQRLDPRDHAILVAYGGICAARGGVGRVEQGFDRRGDGGFGSFGCTTRPRSWRSTHAASSSPAVTTIGTPHHT